jgi:hypothetical protein
MDRTQGGKSPNSPHDHKYTIADDDAVKTLMQKLETTGVHQGDREKLRAAIDSAKEEYGESDELERKAFFHGMLTGIAVALKVDSPNSAGGRAQRKTA